LKFFSRAELAVALSPAAVIRGIEEGFVAYSRGEVVVPPVGHLEFTDPPGDCHIKYGYIRGDDTYTIKIATGFYRNPEKGLPSSNGMMLVFNARTGEPLAMLQDEGYLTDLRTAAAGAVAAKYLAPPEVKCIGIVGAGTQARMQLDLLKEVTQCRRAMIWARSPERAAAFHVDGFETSVAASVRDLCSHCRLIVTTTPSRQALVMTADVQPGTHITAVGADGAGKQEIDAALFVRTGCFVDSRTQCSQFGDSSYAVRAGWIRAQDLVELGELAQNPKLGRQDDAQITIADLTGVAVQDIQIAKMAMAS
jgi:ornithine cyclodeaminase